MEPWEYRAVGTAGIACLKSSPQGATCGSKGGNSNPCSVFKNFGRLNQRETLGGAMGIRTPDLLNAIEALYQLSYDPKRYIKGAS